MKAIDIQYIFKFNDKKSEKVDLRLNPQTLDLIFDVPENLPSWTNLDFHQCPNCLLKIQTHPKCPLTVYLVRLLEIFGQLQSHEMIEVEIITPERIIFRETSAQKGLSSLIGLIMATCGCPHTVFLRPMARFHLPFANALETVYRATSMYLLAQYLCRQQGYEVDLELEGLKKIYLNIQIINKALVDRLRTITDKDIALNALIILDTFAQTVPLAIDESLEELLHLFEHYFSHLK